VELARIASTYRISGPPPAPRALDPNLPEEVRTVLAAMGGVSLDDGLYRCHPPEAVGRMTGVCVAYFPEFAGRVVCFGADWLGRQFAGDAARVGPGGERLVLLLDPGAGEALEVPATVTGCHEDGLVEYAEPALAQSFYQTWRAASGDDRQLSADECVGYRIPLFLGGQDDVDNLERTDLDVYWALSAQLYQGSRSGPAGTA
jgi:hypothetical protein